MRCALLLPLALAAAAAGCSSSSPIESAPAPQTVRVSGGGSGPLAMGMTPSPADARASTVSAPLAEVWRVLPAAYESLNIPVSTVDTATGVMGNSGFNVRRRLGTVPLIRLIDCGTTQGGPSAETYDIRLTVTTRVTAVDGGTRLATTVEPMGKPAAFSGEYIRCSSMGTLESRLADAVKARLAK
jgi:hypothetical protein